MERHEGVIRDVLIASRRLATQIASAGRIESEEHTVTLVYGARDEEHNAALVLKSVLNGRKTKDEA